MRNPAQRRVFFRVLNAALVVSARMNPDDFNYALPDRLIARYPAEPRSASRLMHVEAGGGVSDAGMRDLPDYLLPGDLLVFNDTRVLLARLYGAKQSGGALEILLERVTGSHTATAQIRASHAPKAGSTISLHDAQRSNIASANVTGRDGRFFALTFDTPIDEVMAAGGHVPLPPYIDRSDELSDQTRYQTVYARHPGAVAAPTAGLHFDDALLASLAARGVDSAFVTLHVAAGTFQPLSDAQLESGKLHEEHLIVDDALVRRIAETRTNGGRVICVGTTSLRALESAAADGELRAMSGETSLFIRSGYQFRVADGLLTNFHLPRSSLMMLVCAFAGYDVVMSAYRHAVDTEYRFFSYGDAMLLWRQPGAGGEA